MAVDRLKAGIWIQAQLRLADREGRAFTVLRKGDADAGAVVLKLLAADGRARVLSQATSQEGGLAWHRPLGAAPVTEAEADAYIARQARYDPDLWAVEVIDRGGDWLPDGKILAE